MARKIFISFQHDDRMKAKGFNLLRWNKNVNFEFVGRHLLDPVDSTQDEYVKEKIREQLKGTSATVVLIGRNTAESDYIAYEIEKSGEKGNGLLGIRLYAGAEVPQELVDAGAEVIDWKPAAFQAAIERAVRATGRAAAIASGPRGASGCGR